MMHQKIRPQTNTPTTRAAIVEPIHTSYICWDCFEMPSIGQPKPSNALPMLLAEQPASRVTRVPASTPSEAARPTRREPRLRLAGPVPLATTWLCLLRNAAPPRIRFVPDLRRPRSGSSRICVFPDLGLPGSGLPRSLRAGSSGRARQSSPTVADYSTMPGGSRLGWAAYLAVALRTGLAQAGAPVVRYRRTGECARLPGRGDRRSPAPCGEAGARRRAAGRLGRSGPAVRPVPAGPAAARRGPGRPGRHATGTRRRDLVLHERHPGGAPGRPPWAGRTATGRRRPGPLRGGALGRAARG